MPRGGYQTWYTLLASQADSDCMTSLMRRLALAACLCLLAGCAMHSRATHWNNHVGPDGEPVFVLQSTFVGLNLAALVPFVGSTTIDDMLNESTAWIDSHEGTHLRLVETESSNYWYGAPPLSLSLIHI